MARKVKVVVTGIDKVDRKLRRLPYKIQGKVLRPAMRAGLKVMRAAVRADAPVLTGATRTAAVVRAPLKRKRDVVEYEVRIRAEGALKKTSPKTGKTVFYPAIVEYKYDPFMARAFADSAGAARNVTLRAIKAGLDREIRAS